MSRFAIGASAVWLMAVTCASAHAEEFTESVLLQQLDQSPAADALRRRIDETRASARLRTVIPGPTVAFTQEHAGGTTDSFLLLRQDLPVTGQLGLLRQVGDARIDAVAHAAEWARRQLRAEARLAFARMLVAQAREAAVLAALRDLDALIHVLQVREGEGETSTFDRRRAEREVAEVRRELAVARIELSRAAGLLRPFVPGAPDDLRAAGTLVVVGPPALSALPSRTAGTRSDERSMQTTIDALRLEQRAARRGRLPQPVLTAGVKHTGLDLASGTGYALGVELRLPVFDRGRAAVGAAQAALATASAERDALRTRIDAEVQTAHAVVTELHSLVLAYEQDVAGSGAELARVAQVAYDEGELGILELLDAYRVAMEGQLHAIDLRGRTRAALIELELAAGLDGQ
jgi:outer membrane protein, heavy metal efflux system